MLHPRSGKDNGHRCFTSSQSPCIPNELDLDGTGSRRENVVAGTLGISSQIDHWRDLSQRYAYDGNTARRTDMDPMADDVLDNLFARPCGSIDKKFHTIGNPWAVRCTVPWAGTVDEDSKTGSVVKTEYGLHEMR